MPFGVQSGGVQIAVIIFQTRSGEHVIPQMACDTTMACDTAKACYILKNAYVRQHNTDIR